MYILYISICVYTYKRYLYISLELLFAVWDACMKNWEE